MRGRDDTPHVLIADGAGLGLRQFAPLRQLAAERKIRLRAKRPRGPWRHGAGDYRPLAGRLGPHLRALAVMAPAELAVHRHRGVGVFGCARGELLRLLLKRWPGSVGPNRDPEILDRILASGRDREDLLLCMAAARERIDFWHAVLARDGPFSHAVVHAGGTIEARALWETGRRDGLRLFAAERFPVADFWCFEERAMPLSIGSLLGNPEWCRRLALPEDISRREQVRAEAYRRLLGGQPRQPRSETLAQPPFARRNDGIVLVLGQPADDWSLVEAPLSELSAAAVYRTLIGGLLARSRASIVFTGDPDVLEAWRDGLPRAQQDRLRLVGEPPIDALLPYADWVASISSPALIWVCRAGLKPALIGGSLLAGKGFTHDFADAEAVVAAIAAGRVDGRLSLAEYAAFEEFLIRALVIHLVPNDRRAAAQLAPRLAFPNHVPTLEEAPLFGYPRPGFWRSAVDALAGPVAALRLLGDRRPPAEDGSG
jgi:hypothetical protein